MINCPRCNRSYITEYSFVCSCGVSFALFLGFRYSVSNTYQIFIYNNKTHITSNNLRHSIFILPCNHFNLTKEKIDKLLVLK